MLRIMTTECCSAACNTRVFTQRVLSSFARESTPTPLLQCVCLSFLCRYTQERFDSVCACLSGDSSVCDMVLFESDTACHQYSLLHFTKTSFTRGLTLSGHTHTLSHLLTLSHCV